MKKPLFFCPAIFFLFLLVLALTGGMTNSLPPSPVYNAEDGTNNVILTFNVLWEADEELENVLSFLESQDLKAVFFVTGAWIKEFPDAAANILMHGQFIGNRSLSHRRLILLTEEEIIEEIKGFNQICSEMLDYTPSFFRPPYGEYNSRIVRIAQDEDCITMLWTINVQTLTLQEPELALNYMEERLHPGAIMLFHLYPGVSSLLPQLLDFLTWKGYMVSSPKMLL